VYFLIFYMIINNTYAASFSQIALPLFVLVVVAFLEKSELMQVGNALKK
jgi:hypothetical protein